MADLGQAAAWHRQIAGLATAADRAGVATAELPALRARLFAQQARFGEVAARSGSALPALVPTPVEIAAAASSLGDMSPGVVSRAIQSALVTLDAADRALAGLPTPATTTAPQPVGAAGPAPAAPPGTPVTPPARVPTVLPDAPPTLRNGLVYGVYALCVSVIQLVLFFVLNENSTLLYASPICLLVLPAFAWLAGYLTIGAITPKTPGQAVGRSPRLGAFVCAAPDLLLCAILGVLIAVNLVQR